MIKSIPSLLSIVSLAACGANLSNVRHEKPSAWGKVVDIRLAQSECPDLRGVYKLGGESSSGVRGFRTPFTVHPRYGQGVEFIKEPMTDPNLPLEKRIFEIQQPNATKLALISDSTNKDFRTKIIYDAEFGDFNCENGQFVIYHRRLKLAAESSYGFTESQSRWMLLEDKSLLLREITHYRGTGIFDRRDSREETVYRFRRR